MWWCIKVNRTKVVGLNLIDWSQKYVTVKANQVDKLPGSSNSRNEQVYPLNSPSPLSLDISKKKNPNQLFIPSLEKSPWIFQKDALHSFAVPGAIKTSSTSSGALLILGGITNKNFQTARNFPSHWRPSYPNTCGRLHSPQRWCRIVTWSKTLAPT